MAPRDVEQTESTLVVCASHSPGMARDEDALEGKEFRAGLQAAEERITTFAPELVVIFGSDHRRGFTDVIPPFAVVAGAEGIGDLGSPAGTYDVRSDLADGLTRHLLDGGFDAARVREAHLDHGFGQTFSHLVGELDRLPCLPIFINCASPPLAACARVWALGEAVGTFVRDLGKRVLVIGSGGLSHSPPSLEVSDVGLTDAERRRLNREGMAGAREKIRPEWDRWFLDCLATGDWQSLVALSDHDVSTAGVGAHEIRTWLAAAAVGGAPLETLAYEPVPEWITGMGVVSGIGRVASDAQ